MILLIILLIPAARLRPAPNPPAAGKTSEKLVEMAESGSDVDSQGADCEKVTHEQKTIYPQIPQMNADLGESPAAKSKDLS